MEELHQPGDIVAERYRITDTLGQGGVGITYAAEDLKSGEQVALKVLSLRQMGDWKVLELFEREAKILAQLNHPAIPRYLDYFQVDTAEDRAFYIVQQLAEGKSLADLAKIGWRTNEDGVRKIATQILEILVYLHGLKPPVVHRDIKPQNLIWGKDGKIFLVDFGAVQDTYRSTLAKGSTIVGTYGYMAPEQFRGQAVPATDLYGLGATVLFLLTHRSPSDLPQERLKISFRSRIQVSEGFANWLEKMLEPDAEERFSSAKDALAWLQGRMVVAKPRLSVSWKVLVGVALAAVTSAIVLNFFKYPILNVLRLVPSVQPSIEKGDINLVKDYLQHGGDVNAKDNQGNTLLHIAVENGHKDLVEMLIARGAQVNAKDNQGETPLHRAVRKIYKDIVVLLIAKGAQVNAQDNKGQTPLYRLVGTDLIRALPSGQEQKVDRKLQRQLGDRRNILDLLMAQGAEINARDKHGKTPLYWAIQQNNMYSEVAIMLIEKGADVNIKDNQGKTPLQIALESCWRFDQCAMLRRLFPKAGHELINSWSSEELKVEDKNSNTVLHWAAGSSSRETIELLIAKGARVNAKNNWSQTPLFDAAWGGNKDVVGLLIAKGADVNAKDRNGSTPLHSAVDRYWSTANGYQSNKDVVELLIAKGADVNAKDRNGSTPLHSAVDRYWSTADGYQSNKDVVELLIAKGADVNAKGFYNRTPLYEAATVGNNDVVKLLIAKGADVNAKDNFGSTPLKAAAMNRRKDVVELLKRHGAIQ